MSNLKHIRIFRHQKDHKVFRGGWGYVVRSSVWWDLWVDGVYSGTFKKLREAQEAARAVTDAARRTA
jgi:hypothetical protein